MNTVRPLRIGVLVARKEGFENWGSSIFDRIMADPRFSLITFIVHPNPFGDLKASPLFELRIASGATASCSTAPLHSPNF